MKNVCIPFLKKKNILYIIYKMYMTLKLDDNGCCRIHSVSDDGNGYRIVTNERLCGYALEDGYQKWYKRDPRRGG